MIVKIALISITGIVFLCKYYLGVDYQESTQILNFLYAYGIDLSSYSKEIQLECIKLYQQHGILSLDQIHNLLETENALRPVSPEAPPSLAKILTPDSDDLLELPQQSVLKK